MAGTAHHARPALGQHFLRSSRLADEIVRAAGLAPGTLVVDVGAGHGALTRALARAGARVLAVERDPRLAAELRGDRLGRAEPDPASPSRSPASPSPRPGGFRVVEADAAGLAWPREPFAVVANLPFGVTTAVVSSLLGDLRVPLRRADLIVQLGFALKRAAAWPSTLQGVLWSVGYELSVAARIDRSAFAPPPQVDAALLRAVRRPCPLVPARDLQAFAAFVRAGFRQGARPPLDHRRALELGLSRRAAARDLSAEQWAALFRAVRANR